MKQKVFDLVKGALEELNDELAYGSLKYVTWATQIAGGDSSLDSLTLVMFVVGLETNIEKAFDKKILLADEKAMSVRNSPFRDVNSLVTFIAERLEAANG